MTVSYLPLRFIGEDITVEYTRHPLLRKKPTAPDAFHWQNETYDVLETLSEWFDYTRRGKMARNMRAEHLERAARRGSWGVGRYYFRVRTAGGRCFDLYYDRAPMDADDRAGRWVLYREMQPADESSSA